MALGSDSAASALVEQHLPLQIAGLDVVAIDDAQIADSGACQQGSEGRSGGAAADDGDARGGELLLAFGSDGLKEDLAGVPLGEFQQRYLLSGCILRYYRNATL